MSLGLELILSTTLVATPPACSWAHPAANPYRGDPVRALHDFDLPRTTRDQLRELMRAHRPTDTAVIMRDDIVGTQGSYTDLREMHSGRGRACHGPVDRSAWSAERREPAQVYCVDDACVIVPAICHNVALVSRRAGHVADDEGPIDIEPAAGPPHEGAPPKTASPAEGPLAFLPAPDGGGTPTAPGLPGGDEAGGAAPPIVAPPGDGGGLPSCDNGPVIPVAPGAPEAPGNPGGPDGPGAPGGPAMPPVITPVPDAPAWMLLLAGVAELRPWRRPASRRCS